MTTGLSKTDAALPHEAPLNASNNSAVTALTSEIRVLLEGVSWETYERLLEETGEQRNQLFAYGDGILEIMVPLAGHEEPTRLFDQFLAAIIDQLGWEFRSLGSLTLKNPQQRQGLEPDCCFYIENEAVVRGVDSLDFDIHPPPDLVIEVDNSHASLNKLPIYLALKIPEIWRLQRGVLTMYQLDAQRSHYGESDRSLAFPQLPIQELPQFIERAKVIGQRAAVRELEQRVQQVLARRTAG